MRIPTRCAAMILFFVLLIASAPIVSGADTGVLDTARNRINTPQPDNAAAPNNAEHKPRPHRGAHINVYINDDQADELFWEMALYVVSSPFWLPYYTLEDGKAGTLDFGVTPYMSPVGGYMIRSNAPVAPPSVHGRINMEYGVTTNDVTRLTGRFQIEGAWRIGLDAGFNHFEEKRTSGIDTFTFKDFIVTLRFAQNEYAQFRTGFGIRLFDDTFDGDTQGWTFLYGVDFYPEKPVSCSVYYDGGRVGYAWVSRTRVTVGVVISMVELYAGYEFFKIDDVVLDGPLAGARFYF